MSYRAALDTAALTTPERPALALVTAVRALPPARARPDVLVYPDGVVAARRPRGVYRADFLVGDCWRVYLVDSAADNRRIERLVPVAAGAAGLHAAEAELWALLDEIDPE